MRRLLLILILLGANVGAEPGLYSPSAYQGETFSRTLTWYDANSALVNLTGYTAKLQVYDVTGATVLLTLTESSGLTLGGSAGTIVWAMTAAQTLALAEGDLPYDLRMTSGTSVVTYLVYGYVKVHVTRTR